MSQAMKKSYIYVVENLLNGKVYVGKSNNVRRRWLGHVRDAQGTSKTHFHQAIRKHGAESFVVHIVEEDEDEKYVINVLEPEWITYLRSMKIDLYNMTPGGDDPPVHRGPNPILSTILKGKKKPPRSRAHCEAISRSKKGIKYSEERRRQLSEAMKRSDKVGHPIDEATRNKIAEKLRNQSQSEETRRRRSESLKRQTPEMKARRGRSIKAAWDRRKAAALVNAERSLLVQTALADAEDE